MKNGNEVNYYKKPKFYEFNIQSLSGSLDTVLYGNRILKMKKAIISASEYKNIFKEGDKVYLDGAKPKDEQVNTYGVGANYKIVDVREQNAVIILYFEKI